MGIGIEFSGHHEGHIVRAKSKRSETCSGSQYCLDIRWCELCGRGH